MKNVDILNTINDITRKQLSGRTLLISTFNRYMDVAQSELEDVLEDKYERDSESTIALQKFITPETVAVDGSGQVTYSSLGEDYWRISSAYYEDGDGIKRDVEKLTNNEYSKRLGSSLLQPEASLPVVTEYSNNLQFKPIISTNVELFYLRRPKDPHLDFYINTDGNYVFLDEGETHTWATGEVDSDGVEHTSGDTNWNSKTVELEWNDEEKTKIMYSIMQKVGIPLKDVQSTQYGLAREQYGEA